METMTIEYDNRNAVAVQAITELMERGIFRQKQENDFESGLKRSISGDELMQRMTFRINKMFENDCAISTGN